MRRRRNPLIFAGLTVLAVSLAVPYASAQPDHDGTDRADSASTTAAETRDVPTPSVTGTIAEGLDVPWDMAFLPDGSALVTERESALVKHVGPGGEVSEVAEIEGVVPVWEGGLLGIELAPDFEDSGEVYLYYTAAEDNRVVRMTYADGELSGQEPIITGIEKSEIHNGGRIAFGPDDMLYVATGDAGDDQLSQDPDSVNGKILRTTAEGEPAPDNPNGDLVWSLGHRNVQGLAWDDAGNLWASELGENTFDELNKIEPGANYGWPVCEGPCADDQGQQYVDPELTWSTAEASPSPLAYADGALWMGALRGERLWGIEIQDGEVVGDPVDFFSGEHGRWRAITPGGDGTFWVATNSPDQILELTVGE